MNTSRSGSRAPLAGVLVAALAALLVAISLGLTPPKALGAARNTQPRALTVITANLDKAYGAVSWGNVHDMTSVRAFVTRALQVTPYVPDVIFLQEVRSQGAIAAAKSFTRKTGQKYVVAVMPGKVATTQYGNLQIHKQVSILLNSTTLRQASRGAFIAAKYPKYLAAKGHKVKWEKTGYVYAKERDPVSGKLTGNGYALANAHFTPPDDLKSKSVSDSLRATWSKQIVDKLHTKFPNAAMTDVGGDFNMIRCSAGAFASCKESKFWHYFTTHGFRDSLYSAADPTPGYVSCMMRLTGVDYVFTDRQPVAGGEDTKGGYSDHKLRWTITEASPYKSC
jgi:hypothetical protein